MKLKQFRVRDFRSVLDSGPVVVDDRVTCLVGKNEAGKTALLTALYRTNPILSADAEFDETYDYPKREVEEYRLAVEQGDREVAEVVECEFDLDDDDLKVIADDFGPKVLRGRHFKRTTYYGKHNSRFSLTIDEDAARKHLVGTADISEAVKSDLSGASNWDDWTKVLDATEATDAVKKLKSTLAKFREKGLAHYIFNELIWPRAPKYLYFDEYYQMTGHENLQALISRQQANKLEPSDHPLIGLINLARLNLRDLVGVKNTAELKNRLEGAGNYLTTRIMKYWSQNQHVKMEFDVRDAKPDDPEGMRQGTNIWGEIYDTVHWSHTPLGTRSRGFVWFFSFLAWYEDIKRQKQNVILLLDEPGLSLHGRAQGDLLRYFETELEAYQLLYSTHSPFMIDPKQFGRVRIVQDRGIDAKEMLPKEVDGTKVLTDVFDAGPDSLFPLQGALGYDIHQTLFIGPNSVVVEGAADMLFLRAASVELEREGRTGLSEDWIITPIGGSAKVPTFVALLAPQKGMNIATLLDIQSKDKQMIEDLYKKKLLKKKQVLTYADFLKCAEADIEDLFPRAFYVDMVNKEFAKQLVKPLNISDLNANEPRVLRAIEQYLETHPLKSGQFGHYRPARYFSEHTGELWKDLSDATKGYFEEINKALNKLL